MARTILQTRTNVTHADDVINRDRSVSILNTDLTPLLRKQRSRQYLSAVAALDAGTHLHDPVAFQALQQAIRQEFPEVELARFPLLGIVSRCNLGRPFEVHTLDLSGQIVHHYKNSESLPPLLERARSLSLCPAYAFVEVYIDQLVAVLNNGDTAVIQE